MSDTVSNYGWSNSDGPESCGYISPKVIELIQSDRNIRSVCDLGSGNGTLAGELARAGYKVCGIEYDSRGCEIARNKHPHINFYNLGVQDSPEEVKASEGIFDAIVSTEVIEHLFAPHLLPVFAKQILSPRGKLIISTPYHGYLKNLALSLFNKWDSHHTALWHGGHIKFWSRNTLTQLLESEGFIVKEFHGVGRAPYLWKSMIMVAELGE